MDQKALVHIQAVTITTAHEPTLAAVLLSGVLLVGMEAVWEGTVLVISSMQVLTGEAVATFSEINQPLELLIQISDPSKLIRLRDQRLTFWSERSIPLVDSLHSWQTEPTT